MVQGLSSKDASRFLGVSRTTLYAYGSRGLVGPSTPPANAQWTRYGAQHLARRADGSALGGQGGGRRQEQQGSEWGLHSGSSGTGGRSGFGRVGHPGSRPGWNEQDGKALDAAALVLSTGHPANELQEEL